MAHLILGWLKVLHFALFFILKKIAQNNIAEILQSFLRFMRLSSIGKIEAFLANLSVVV